MFSSVHVIASETPYIEADQCCLEDRSAIVTHSHLEEEPKQTEDDDEDTKPFTKAHNIPFSNPMSRIITYTLSSLKNTRAVAHSMDDLVHLHPNLVLPNSPLRYIEVHAKSISSCMPVVV